MQYNAHTHAQAQRRREVRKSKVTRNKTPTWTKAIWKCHPNTASHSLHLPFFIFLSSRQLGRPSLLCHYQKFFNTLFFQTGAYIKRTRGGDQILQDSRRICRTRWMNLSSSFQAASNSTKTKSRSKKKKRKKKEEREARRKESSHLPLLSTNKVVPTKRPRRSAEWTRRSLQQPKGSLKNQASRGPPRIKKHLIMPLLKRESKNGWRLFTASLVLAICVIVVGALDLFKPFEFPNHSQKDESETSNQKPIFWLLAIQTWSFWNNVGKI